MTDDERIEDIPFLLARLNTANQRSAERDAEIERLRLQAKHSLANNLCPDHRDKQAGKPCLACEVERLTSENSTLRSDAERYRAMRLGLDDPVFARHFDAWPTPTTGKELDRVLSAVADAARTKVGE